jgi:hypothetical protein
MAAHAVPTDSQAINKLSTMSHHVLTRSMLGQEWDYTVAICVWNLRNGTLYDLPAYHYANVSCVPLLRGDVPSLTFTPRTLGLPHQGR